MSGVCSLAFSRALMAALFASSTFTAETWPEAAAIMSGVAPVCVAALVSPPPLTSASMTSLCPRCPARCSGV